MDNKCGATNVKMVRKLRISASALPGTLIEDFSPVQILAAAENRPTAQLQGIKCGSTASTLNGGTRTEFMHKIRFLLLAVFVGFPIVAAGADGEHGFLKENDAAMAKMMARMTVHPLGDVDDDFVSMMEPHHQGAIDMAVLELRYGHNEKLKRIAQEIIVDQQQEIAAMRLATGRPLPPSARTPD